MATDTSEHLCSVQYPSGTAKLHIQEENRENIPFGRDLTTVMWPNCHGPSPPPSPSRYIYISVYVYIYIFFLNNQVLLLH